ncbi:hypothetical protein HCH05_18705 [Enterococcus raffinosus]|uniref:hypothetical protein n=1 Tax=Enterococcus raffinosus TaxID=71452 RepID=UPI001C8CC4FF|nr:hypothetical protein [Enterococcus raffinosus]MBX9039076.1 hypothetical protein [Enterococcus raffinosus]
MSNVQFQGVTETIQALEKKLGTKKIRKVTRDAIDEGASDVEEQLKWALLTFKDTGATVDEVVRSLASYKNYNAEAEIGWNGPKQRYRLIHLNEWGYTRNGRQIKPRGFGVITKSLKSSEKIYLNAVARELRNKL